jgi:PEP-CTERM motif
MKKLVLATVCAMAMSGAAFAQGLIAWNTPSSSITVQTNTAISPLFGGTGTGGTVGNTFAASTGVTYYYALLYQAYPGLGAGGLATDTSVWDGTWFSTGLTATNATFAHNVTPQTPASGTTLTVSALSTTQSVVIVGWSANLGSDWTTVSNALKNWSTSQIAGAYFGETSFGYINGNSSPSPGASIFGNGTASANGLPIFSLNTQLYLLPSSSVVPEPATMVLAGLGGLSLLLFRRQRK